MKPNSPYQGIRFSQFLWSVATDDGPSQGSAGRALKLLATAMPHFNANMRSGFVRVKRPKTLLPAGLRQEMCTKACQTETSTADPCLKERPQGPLGKVPRI